jgi:hypothetical protein
MTDLKYFLPLYIGCEVKVKNNGIVLLDYEFLNDYYDQDSGEFLNDPKLILRPLESMTEEEGVEFYKTFKMEAATLEGLYRPEWVVWLCKRGFDIFRLHKSGLCLYRDEKGEFILNFKIMKHEKLIVRPDRTKLMIVVSLSRDFSRVKYDYAIDLRRCLPGKRKWFNPIDYDSHEHRSKSFPDGRAQHIKEQILKLVSAQEILEVKLELWNLIKPSLDEKGGLY